MSWSLRRAIVPIATPALLFAALLFCGAPREADAGRAVNMGFARQDAAAPPPTSFVGPWAVNGLFVESQSTGVAYPGGNCAAGSAAQQYHNTTVFDADGGYNTLPDAAPVASPTYFGSNYVWHPLDCGANFIRPNSVIAFNNGFDQYPSNIESIGAGNGEAADFVADALVGLLDAGGTPIFNTTNTGIAGVVLASRSKGGTLDAYPAALSDAHIANNLTARAITAVTIGNPTKITSAGHGLSTGNYAYVQGLGGTTEANGYYQVTVLDANDYTIPVNSTHAFTGGTLSTCPVGVSSPCAYQTSYGAYAVIGAGGESDAYFWTLNATYQSQLLGWPTNLQSDLPAFTGQTQTIPLFELQQNSSTASGFAMPTLNITGQVDLAIIGTSNVYVVGPRYQYPGLAIANPHFTASGYLWAWEMTGLAMETVAKGGNWLPLYPTSKTVVSSTQVLVNFHVPVPPLQFDGTTSEHTSGTFAPYWPSTTAYGFEALNDTGISLSQVTGSGTSPIQITTSAAYAGTGITNGGMVCDPGYVSTDLNANGCFNVTTTGSTTYTLNGTTGAGTGCASACLYRSRTLLTPIAISSVAICTGSGTPVSFCQNNAQVAITLAAGASGTLYIGYADTPDQGNQTQGCAFGGECGQLMDSRNFCGPSGRCQNDYALSFSLL